MKAWGAAVLLLLPALVLSPVLIGRTEFFYRDVTRQYQPLQAQLDRAWHERTLPLWNASTQSGVPLLANLHAGVLAPWVPLFRLLPFHRAYGLAVALAWGTMMAGLWVYLRSKLGAAPSLLGALTLGFCGVVLGTTSYLPLLAGLSCIPWQLVALEQHRPLSRVSGLAALFTLQVLMGDPSTALMGGLTCLLAVWLQPSRGGTSSVLFGGALGLGLSAVQLLPAWTLYEESARAGASLETRLAWSFHPSRMLEWFVRRPWGELMEPPYFSRWDLAAGPDAQPFLLEHGWGLLALLLLGAGLTAPGPLRRLGASLIALGLVLSLGRHLGPLQQLFTLPPLSMFRFPERYGALASLGSALLTAHGAAALLSSFTLRQRWAVAWFAIASGLGAAAFTHLLPEGPVSVTALLLGTAALLGFALSRVHWAWLGVVLAAGAVDAALAVRASVLTLPVQPLPLVAVPTPGHRVWRENAPLRALERPVRGSDAFARERALLHATLASATPGLHAVDELGGFSPVSLRRWQRVIQATAGRPALLSSLFDVCSFVSTRERGRLNPDWVAGATLAEDTVLYQTKTCGGRAWVVTSAVDVASTEEAVQRMLAPGFEPTTMATREGAAEPVPALGMTTVELLGRTSAGRVELQIVPTEQWTLLVVSETWAPGWQVWVDDVERPVELLDGTLLGVLAPPGSRALRFEYDEPLLSTGAALSAATLLLLTGLWLRRGRHEARA